MNPIICLAELLPAASRCFGISALQFHTDLEEPACETGSTPQHMGNLV